MLAAGGGRGHVFISSVSLLSFSFSLSLLYMFIPSLHCLLCPFSPFLWEMTQNDPQGLTCRFTTTQTDLNL